MAEGPQYGFPILTAEECVNFLKEVSIPNISEEDFKKPEAKRWQVFYKSILEMMLGTEVDLGAAQNRLHALADCDNSDLHQESFHLMAFFLMLRRAMEAATIVDFNLRDLVEPKPKRLLRIISGAINFIMYRFQREETYNKKKADLERKRERYDAELRKNAELKSLLKAKQKAHEARMMETAQRQEENERTALRIEELNKKREGLQRNIAEMKTQLSQKTAANDQLKVDILSAKAEGEKLSQRIIESPDRLKAEQERAKTRIVGLKATVESKLGRLAELEQQQNHLQQQLKASDQAVRIMKDIANDVQRQRELEKEVQRLEDQRQDGLSSLKELNAKAEGLRAVYNSRREKLNQMDMQYHMKKAALERENSKMSQLKASLPEPQGPSGLTRAQVEQEIQRRKDETERKMKVHQETIQHCNNLYSDIVRKVKEDDAYLAEKMQKLKASTSPKP